MKSPLCHRCYEGLYNAIRTVIQLSACALVRVRRHGPAPKLGTRGVILCANHESYLDPAVIQLTLRRRVTFVMTNDFYQVPGIRLFFRFTRAIPVARGRMARAAIRKATALVRCGEAVSIFPEGRLTTDGTLGSAQRGTAQLARRSGALVFPIAITGSRASWPRGRWFPRAATMRVQYGTPIRWTAEPGQTERESDKAFLIRLMDAIAALRDAPLRRNPPT